jgi:hypothetical protein
MCRKHTPANVLAAAMLRGTDISCCCRFFPVPDNYVGGEPSLLIRKDGNYGRWIEQEEVDQDRAGGSRSGSSRRKSIRIEQEEVDQDRQYRKESLEGLSLFTAQRVNTSTFEPNIEYDCLYSVPFLG